MTEAVTSTPNVRPTRKTRVKRRAMSERSFAFLLIAPSLIFIGIIVAWPLLETIRLSFTNANLGGEEYVGFANYEKLANSRKFQNTVQLTFVWMFFSVFGKLIMGLIGASLLNAAVPGKALFRVLIMPPWIVPIAIGCIGWLWMYNGYFGLLSGLLQRFGILDGPYEFLAYKDSAFWATIVTDIWIGVPMVTLFFLAAMQGVPRDLYEAAYVDGASRWYRFRRITLPQIFPVIMSMMLLSAIWTFNSFEIIYILTGGGPRNATMTLIVDTYRTAIGNFKFGEGAARAVVIVILLSIFSLVYMWVLNRIAKRYRSDDT